MFFEPYLSCYSSIFSQILVCCSWDYGLSEVWSPFFNQVSGTWSNFQLKVVLQMDESASWLYVLYVRENLAQLVSHLPCNARVPSSNPSCTRMIFFFFFFSFFFCLVGNQYIWHELHKAKKKKLLCCPHPTKIWKLGRSVDFFFFFFFLRTVRELSFPIFFLKFLNGENSGGMQSKHIYTSAFLSHWIQILANSSPKSDIFTKKKKKKPDPVFSHFTVGRERAT